MAILKLEDGTTYTQVDDIARELAPLNVQLKRWSIGDNPDFQNLLAKDVLSDEEKAQVQGSA
jgi:1,2-dihydroxy-3-keto-5-methylthiopentene dioxygenase